jgi:acyl-homoserine lactone acylase PvdQ
MRMIIQISSHGVTGRSVLPGGESSDPASASFADQARVWLGDRAYPLRFAPSDVAHGVTHHVVLSPPSL